MKAPLAFVDVIAEYLAPLGNARAKARVEERARARRTFVVEVIPVAGVPAKHAPVNSPAAALHDVKLEACRLQSARALGTELRVRAEVDGRTVAVVAHMRLVEREGGVLDWADLRAGASS